MVQERPLKFRSLLHASLFARLVVFRVQDVRLEAAGQALAMGRADGPRCAQACKHWTAGVSLPVILLLHAAALFMPDTARYTSSLCVICVICSSSFTIFEIKLPHADVLLWLEVVGQALAKVWYSSLHTMHHAAELGEAPVVLAALMGLLARTPPRA